jgi:hypothetical protein
LIPQDNYIAELLPALGARSAAPRSGRRVLRFASVPKSDQNESWPAS